MGPRVAGFSTLHSLASVPKWSDKTARWSQYMIVLNVRRTTMTLESGCQHLRGACAVPIRQKRRVVPARGTIQTLTRQICPRGFDPQQEVACSQ